MYLKFWFVKNKVSVLIEYSINLLNAGIICMYLNETEIVCMYLNETEIVFVRKQKKVKFVKFRQYLLHSQCFLIFQSYCRGHSF